MHSIKRERASSIIHCGTVNEIPEALHGRADPDRLEQVFVNLVDNAVKYGRANGRVVVKGRTVNGSVELCVTDDGPGIPPEARERVLDRKSVRVGKECAILC